jgi:hypothetical protein
MIGNRICAFVLSTAFAIICSAPPAIAAHDRNWLMVAVTTRGHCGKINIGLVIRSGRIYSAGGSFARHPIQVDGRISASGSDQCSGWPAHRSWDRAVQ